MLTGDKKLKKWQTGKYYTIKYLKATSLSLDFSSSGQSTTTAQGLMCFNPPAAALYHFRRKSLPTNIIGSEAYLLGEDSDCRIRHVSRFYDVEPFKRLGPPAGIRVYQEAVRRRMQATFFDWLLPQRLLIEPTLYARHLIQNHKYS